MGHVRFERHLFAVFSFAVLILLFLQPGFAQVPDRVPAQFRGSAVTALRGSVDVRVSQARDLGRIPSTEVLSAVTVNLSPSADQLAALRQLVEQQSDPTSPQFHQWLTQQEFGARFGVSEGDMDRIVSWFTSQGLSLQRIAPSRNAVTFRGTAAQVEAAFHTELHRYNLEGDLRTANATTFSLPPELAAVVTSVRGLNGFRPHNHLSRQAKPAFTTASGNHFLSPAGWATIYNVNAIYSAGYTGSGTHVGIIGQTYAPQADIDHFRSASGLPATKINYACISSADCTSAAGTSSDGDLMESDLDIEWAGGIAKNATVDFIYSAYDDTSLGVFEALQYAIQNYTVEGAVVPVLSMSYGSCEYFASTSDTAFFENLGLQANAQGQTILVSSGDSGGAGCDPHGDPNHVLAVGGQYADVPADVPNFTGVGGTQFSGDVDNPTPYWSTSTSSVATALQYIPETGWNESGIDGLIASGGGVSTLFPKPSWQATPANFTGTPGRFVPDVSMTASWLHDGYLICSQADFAYGVGTPCANGFLTEQRYFFMAGGTSASAPSLAGILAMLTQKYGKFGNINPLLYQLAAGASAASVYRDITTGSNLVSCYPGTLGCVNNAMGYTAAAGYDLVTGLGSINAGGLYNALASYSKTTATSIAATASTTTASMGDTITLTGTISSSPSASITGSLTFYNGTISLGSAALSGNVATLPVTVTSANGFTGGASSLITVSFAGDSTYSSASGVVSVSVAALGATNSILTNTPTTVTLGDTLSMTATVTGADGGTPTGTVQFSSNGTNLGTATLANGSATLSNVPVTRAGGFSAGASITSVRYLGDPMKYAASSANAALQVNGYPTSLTSSAPASSALSSPITITGTVTSSATGTGSPSGYVEIHLGGYSVGEGSVSQGQANVTFTPSSSQGFVAGSNTVRLEYTGDATFAPSTGFATVVLTKQNSGLMLSNSPQAMGNAISIMVYSNTAQLTGEVTFSIGSTVLGTASLVGNRAVLTGVQATPNLFSLGKNTISFSYPGDSNTLPFNGSGDLDIYQPTSLSFSITPNSVSAGDTVVLSATVTPAPANGVVRFNWNSMAATTNLVNGTASTSIAVTSANGFYTQANTLYANYDGNSVSNFQTYGSSSNSAALTITSSPAYTMSASTSALSVAPGSNGSVTLDLTPTVYSGTVSFAVTTSSSAISASILPVTFVSGRPTTGTLTVIASANARNLRHPLPWQTDSAAALCAMLLVWPLWRRRATLLALALALTVVLAGLLVSCGGGGGGSRTPPSTPRSYTVTVTPTGSGTVTNPSPITIAVTVQ